MDKISFSKGFFNRLDAFVFDMDGTTLTDKKQVLKSTLETMKFLKDNSKKIIIATGRPYWMAKKILDQMPADYQYICANGSLIHSLDGKVISSTHIDNKEAIKIIEILKDLGLSFIAYSATNLIGYKVKDNLYLQQRYDFNIGNIYQENLTNEELKKQTICKFLIHYGNRNDLIDKLKEKVANAKLKTIYYVESQPELFDIVAVGASKGEGLKKIAKLNNLNLERTICFGDADNDVPMFKVVNYSACPANSSKEATENAIFKSSLSNNEDWIKNFVDNLVK